MRSPNSRNDANAGRRRQPSATTCCARSIQPDPPARRHHRITGVLDTAVGARVRALAGRTRACRRARHTRSRAGRPRRGPSPCPVQPAATAQRVFDRHAVPHCSRHSMSRVSTVDHRGGADRQRPVVLQRRRSGRVRHVRRPGQRAPGPHPVQPGAGARRADRAPRPQLPCRSTGPGAGQRAGDGRVLRLGEGATAPACWACPS